MRGTQRESDIQGNSSDYETFIDIDSCYKSKIILNRNLKHDHDKLEFKLHNKRTYC